MRASANVTHCPIKRRLADLPYIARSTGSRNPTETTTHIRICLLLTPIEEEKVRLGGECGAGDLRVWEKVSSSNLTDTQLHVLLATPVSA